MAKKCKWCSKRLITSKLDYCDKTCGNKYNSMKYKLEGLKINELTNVKIILNNVTFKKRSNKPYLLINENVARLLLA